MILRVDDVPGTDYFRHISLVAFYHVWCCLLMMEWVHDDLEWRWGRMSGVDTTHTVCFLLRHDLDHSQTITRARECCSSKTYAHRNNPLKEAWGSMAGFDRTQ